ncbi:MAG: carbon starvation protein A [Blastocatellia bacterium]|nr:carbon starvation protein A [Blastocatellia bacterium]MCS7156889.1 carbon starvation protein A [Blastocatellia bacterium]MCX7752088.1 carbon starvation protein A [Blastocatellia bacterium]MDW8167581.1 carbon starvation CstA family protein [Acidobacteriota bacterium]MDW8256181.1 carbon starvation CstA family protein [Acidobacteriota bacterium]
MNIGALMGLSLLALLGGYFLYGRFVARWAGIDPRRPTPAMSINDGVDFVPTRAPVLFGHHFASIAAAGPIVGPTLAVMYGFLPAWLWIIIGVIFIGAVHDFIALFVSVREGGRSVAEVARRTLGKEGFVFFAAFAILLCILVAAAFLQLTAVALTSLYPARELGLGSEQTLIKTTVKDGIVYAKIGGIASTSVVIITALAPVVGWLLYKRRVRTRWMSVLALLICALSVWVGLQAPITLSPTTWMLIICGYVFVAAWIPVWLVLQPRDFVNVHLLYIGLAAMVIGVIGGGWHGVTMNAPVVHLTSESTAALGWAWPFLFVTIACGACSGAHALIAGGTTCKQLASEKDAPIIGYGGMLLEALLGICVTLIILGALSFDEYKTLVWPMDESGRVKAGNAPLAFAVAVGKMLHVGLEIPAIYGTIFGILMLEGFLLTTVDTLVRLTRYLLEELWTAVFSAPPAFLRNRVINSLIALSGIASLTFTNAYQAIWPVFGSANQLLAALTLLTATAWLFKHARKVWFTALPAVFMIATTMTSLALLLPRHARTGNWTLAGTDALLLILAFGMLVVIWRYFRWRAPSARLEAPAPAYDP